MGIETKVTRKKTNRISHSKTIAYLCLRFIGLIKVNFKLCLELLTFLKARPEDKVASSILSVDCRDRAKGSKICEYKQLIPRGTNINYKQPILISLLQINNLPLYPKSTRPPPTFLTNLVIVLERQTCRNRTLS